MFTPRPTDELADAVRIVPRAETVPPPAFPTADPIADPAASSAANLAANPAGDPGEPDCGDSESGEPNSAGSRSADSGSGGSRWAMVRWIGLAALPAAIAVAVGAALVVPRIPAPTAAPADAEIAFVRAQIARALAVATSDVVFQRSVVRTSGSADPVREQDQFSLADGSRMLTSRLDPDTGRPEFAEQRARVGDAENITEIHYPARSYSLDHYAASAAPAPTAPPATEEIRGELATTGLEVSSRNEVIDGQPTIELRAPDVDLWVAADSYLPVRLVTHTGGMSEQADYHWLAPTAASLARLTVSVPPGFAQTRAALK
ncbi:MAG TPA: hypothetical protein VG756_26510 [Pseudonocardiaceae bacterium]|nr:hypothetical protein [Pseudonocardiaceae bacterium]